MMLSATIVLTRYIKKTVNCPDSEQVSFFLNHTLIIYISVPHKTKMPLPKIKCCDRKPIKKMR